VSKVKSLQDEQQRLLDGLRDSLISVFTQDDQCRYTWVGNALFGKDPIDLIGKTDEEVFTPDDARRLLDMKKHVLTRGERLRRRVEVQILGKQRVFDMYLEPRRSTGGVIDGVSCVAVDVSQWEGP
jgi:hypothetical protein